MRPRKSVMFGAAGFVLAAVTVSSYLVIHSGGARDPGRLGYVTTSGQVELVAVHADGSLTDRRVIGPVSAASMVTVHALAASGDGKWIGWVEEPKDPAQGTETVVVRSTDGISPPLTGTVPGGVAGIEFTGGRVVEIGSDTAQASSITSPLRFAKLVTPANTEAVLHAVSQGLLVLTLPHDAQGLTQQVTLVATDGNAVTVRRFPSQSYTEAGLSGVSTVTFAGDQILLERGDHTDFCGVSPSSDSLLVDLRGGATRSLGHPGTAAQQWRLESATFAGTSPVAVWATCRPAGVTNDKAPTANTYMSTSAGWRLLRRGAAIAAGGPNGALLAQPSRYFVRPGTGGNAFDVAPTGDAVLINGAQQRPIALRGIEFAWVP
jgi:hypothetical protein